VGKEGAEEGRGVSILQRLALERAPMRGPLTSSQRICKMDLISFSL
jgi:hypothetical protein